MYDYNKKIKNPIKCSKIEITFVSLFIVIQRLIIYRKQGDLINGAWVIKFFRT